MFKPKKFWLSLLGVLLSVILLVCSLNWSRQNVAELTRWHRSKVSPVIMIPGSSATENRFDRLVKKLNQNANEKHSLLKVRVTNDDQIHYSGSIRPGDNEPIIVVGFENNHDGYDNIKQQARRFALAFEDLNEQYNFNNFKAIGHSNGGLIYTAFLEKYYPEYAQQVTLKRLMTIGTPYNFNEGSMQHKTQMLSDFIKDRKKLPTELVMYSVAGSQTYNADGLVPVGSVLAGRYIYQGQVKQFTTITVSGEDAQHSALPQNDQIVELIERYMLDHVKKRPTIQGMPQLKGNEK